MTVKLLTEHLWEFLSLKGGCTVSAESTIFKKPRCWKSHVAADFVSYRTCAMPLFNIHDESSWARGLILGYMHTFNASNKGSGESAHVADSLEPSLPANAKNTRISRVRLQYRSTILYVVSVAVYSQTEPILLV